MQHVKMRDSFGDLWVAESRVEEYLAAGCVLADDSEAEPTKKEEPKKPKKSTKK